MHALVCASRAPLPSGCCSMTEEELALRLATYESPMSSRNPDAERSRLAAAQEREQAAAAVAASNILATDVSVSKQAYLQELLTLMGTIRAERDKFHDEARVLKKAFAALYAKKTQLDALVSQKAASEAALVDEVEMLRQENAKLRMMCQSMHLPYGRSSQFDDFNPGAMAF
ncbi:hypothetical protein EON67_10145 [archaeon]|nr:MAG: hypothetical protein EON67_10145 [archaeon]